ncbi:5-carboxymethyl-2-hydroxymuconate Delta-isomerase [Litoribacillus peritrichatus]|uniref:5-carboxymethyl-2-hydroxymuconate isomerase n=1 Tax=Litoribacillus peritrichatus TaxID=718191 RepID=A0ABP7N4V5_9GAMM
MPHCIVEYSSDLMPETAPTQMMEAVLKGALNSALFDRKDIKLRAMSYETYLGGHDSQRFIHVELKILSGRNNEQKVILTESVLNQLRGLNLSDISISVEVTDTDKDSYRKSVK